VNEIIELKKLLSESTLSTRRIAKLSRVSHVTIHRLRNGSADNVTVQTYNKIKGALNAC